MNFIVDKKTFERELIFFSKLILSKEPNHTSTLVLESSEDGILVYGTDNNISLKSFIPAEVSSSGKAFLKAEKLLNAIKGFPEGEISFEQKEGKVILNPFSGGKKNMRISTELPEVSGMDYPQLVFETEERYYSLSQRDFLEMMKKTSFAVAKQDPRAFLKGVLLEKKEERLIMVATDSKRLSLCFKNNYISIPEFSNMILPVKFLDIMKDLCTGEGDLEFSYYNNLFFVKVNNRFLFTTLMEGSYPKYENVIPKKFDFSFEVSYDDLLSSLRRATSIIVNDRTKKVIFSFAPGLLKISAEEEGKSSNEIEIAYTGNAFDIALNAEYLLDILKNNEEKKDMLELSLFYDAKKPLLLKRKDSTESVNIIMPMQM